MALTEQEKARLRHVWRSLAKLALTQPGAEEFKRAALDATNWLSPLEAQADAYVLFAFARLSVAYVRSRVDDQPRRIVTLASLAEEVRRVLRDDDAPDPPRLPFRADIDG